MASVGIGLLLSLVRPFRRWRIGRHPFFKRDRLINDVLNGAMIVPFGVMVFSIFMPDLSNSLAQSAKVTMSLGGAVGLAFVIAELFKGKP
jgi:hypothetical protein